MLNRIIKNTPVCANIFHPKPRNRTFHPIIHVSFRWGISVSYIKYVSRWRAKNGIADLEKARHFIDLLIELERKNGAAQKKDASGGGNAGLGGV